MLSCYCSVFEGDKKIMNHKEFRALKRTENIIL